MRLSRTLVAAALVAPAPAWAARPPEPVTDAAVRACVAQNLVRYSDPQHAAVLQYVDIEAACRAALAGGGGDVQVQIVPIGSRSAGKAGAPPGAPAATGRAASSPRSVGPKAAARAPRLPKASGTSKASGTAGRSRRPPQVAGLLAAGSSPRAPAPGLVDSAPWWALALGGAILLGAGARALVGARRQPR